MGDQDFIESLTSNSIEVVTAIVEPSLANVPAGQRFQFERHGYIVADRVDHAVENLASNLAVGLKDSWGKLRKNRFVAINSVQAVIPTNTKDIEGAEIKE